MRWLIYLYPKTWRKRYGDELSEILNHTDPSFKIIMDLFTGIMDAWHVELNEKHNYSYRIVQLLVAVTIVNAFLVLNLKPLGEATGVNIFATIVVLIAMSSLFLAVGTFGYSIFKYGKEGFTLKPKLTKTSVGLMGVYGVFITTFLVLIN